MWRIVAQAAVMLLALAGFVAPAAARGGTMFSADRWNPEHIEGLPSGIRNAVARYEQACGAPLAAERAFARYLQDDASRYRFIALHFEHLRCGDLTAICTNHGCLHQVYVSAGGPYRPALSFYVPEIVLKIQNGTPAVVIDCAFSDVGCQRVLYWNGHRFRPK